LVVFLIPSHFLHLFCNQSKCILLFFSCISSLNSIWLHFLFLVFVRDDLLVTNYFCIGSIIKILSKTVLWSIRSGKSNILAVLICSWSLECEL
jgi:hypothetical protein